MTVTHSILRTGAARPGRCEILDWMHDHLPTPSERKARIHNSCNQPVMMARVHNFYHQPGI